VLNSETTLGSNLWRFLVSNSEIPSPSAYGLVIIVVVLPNESKAMDMSSWRGRVISSVVLINESRSILFFRESGSILLFNESGLILLLNEPQSVLLLKESRSILLLNEFQSVTLFANLTMVEGYINNVYVTYPFTFDDNWHHLALTYNGKNISLFINGNNVANTSYPNHRIDVCENSLYIGRFYCGYLDEISIYQEALTQEQIQNHYLNPGIFEYNVYTSFET